MDSNLQAVSPDCDSPNVKTPLSKLNIDSDPAINRDIYNEIVKSNLADVLDRDKRAKNRIAYLEKVNAQLLEKINSLTAQVDTTDNTGENFKPGEEVDIVPPQWTDKGTHCVSTAYIRSQIKRRAKFEILFQQKQEELKVPKPSDICDVTEEINDLVEYVLRPSHDAFYSKSKDCDRVRELLGSDHASSRWHQRILLNTVYGNTLFTKAKALQVQLSNLEYKLQAKIYSCYEKSMENMRKEIESVPKFHSKKLFCRNKSCQECNHPEKPTLAYHGLDRNKKRKKLPEPRQKSPEPRPYLPEPRQYSPEPRRYSPEPRRYSPEPRRYSPEPRQYSPEPRRYSPEPRRYSPEPRRYLPEPCRYSPEPRQYSPEPQCHSPERRRRSSEPLSLSPEPNQMLPEYQYHGRTPDRYYYDNYYEPEHCGNWDYPEPGTSRQQKYRKYK